MSKINAVIDFSGYSGAALAPVAQTIHDQMTTNAATFPKPLVSMSTLQALIGKFETALAAKASRATADTIAFNLARHDLEGALADNGGYVNAIAKGDPSIVSQSGSPSFDTARTSPNTAPPAAPGNGVLLQGDLSGSLVARYHADRQRSMNEVQTCVGDPTVEANWKHAGMFSGGKATVSGIVPGTTVWVRVRTAGLKGVMGEWSSPAKIIVV